jgi:SnoaL-like domain
MHRLFALVVLIELVTSHSSGATAPAKSVAQRANAAVVAYLAAWNEREPQKRRELIARAWAPSGSYVDAHRQATGVDELDTMIRTAQEKFPGYTLRLSSGIEAHHTFVRFSWVAGGTAEAPLFLGGTDVFTLSEDGHLTAVVGFVDASPAS